VAPSAQYAGYYVPAFLPGYMTTDDRALALWRTVGTNTARISTLNGYYVPFKTGDGSVFTWTTTLQMDAYQISNEQLLSQESVGYDGTQARIFPQTALKWQYPLVTHNDKRSYLIEPEVQVVAAPRGDNPNKIPNEDSQAIILDETNLFALNRYQGRDRVSSGQRVDYGVRASMYGDNTGSAEVFIGQSERLQDDGTYPVGSGLEHNLSNLVGSIHVSPGDWVDFGYKADLDSRTGSLDRGELSMTLFHWGGSFSTGLQQYSSVEYQSISNAATGATTNVFIPAIKSLSFIANVPFLKYYTANAYYLYDAEHGETQQIQAGILYRDECFGITFQYQRVYYEFQDIVPSNSFVVRFGLKYLGDFGG
jgi:LPS-assembly protein